MTPPMTASADELVPIILEECNGKVSSQDKEYLKIFLAILLEASGEQIEIFLQKVPTPLNN